MAKLIKQQILMSKTSQFITYCKDVSGYVAQLKQPKSKRWYYLSAHWLYDRCADM